MPIPLASAEPEPDPDPGQPGAAPAVLKRNRAPRTTAPAQLRRTVIETLRRIGPDGPIFFDGSVHATAILGGVLALGGKTWLTAARLDEPARGDDPPIARVVRELAGQLGLAYRSATIPRRTSQCFADLRDILRVAPEVDSEELPRCQAVLHAARAVRAGGSPRLFGGFAAAPSAAASAVADSAAAMKRAMPSIGRIIAVSGAMGSSFP